VGPAVAGKIGLPLPSVNGNDPGQEDRTAKRAWIVCRIGTRNIIVKEDF
jgi:hypothetical protein